MATAGFTGSIGVSATDSSYNDIGGANDVSFDDNAADLDVTEFSDEQIQRIAGLQDAEFSVSAHFKGSDTAQGTIRTQKAAGNTIFVQYLPDGTSGWKAECICTSISTGQSVDGTVTVEYSFALAEGGVVVV